MTPVREFTVAVSETGTRDEDFREAVRGSLPEKARSGSRPTKASS
jgi:hypothetical protein